MLRRAASGLMIGLSMLGGVAAVLQPYHAAAVQAAPAPPTICTGVATTTGVTTTLGYVTTSTVSTIVTSFEDWWWWFEFPGEPGFPGGPIGYITETLTTTVPVTETTTGTVTTTGYVTTTDACPTTTTSSATTTTADPPTSSSTTTSTTTSASSTARPAAPAAMSYVSGTVTHDGGQPLAGAIVSVGGVSDKTDTAGHFRAGPLGAGSYTVTITYSNGYTAASRSSYPVQLDGLNQATLNFYAVSKPAK
jgi:hypothetical protein